jgi:multicomponent Na+:H+ antiporter subunit D
MAPFFNHQLIAILPLIVNLSVLAILTACWNSIRWQKIIHVIGLFFLLLATLLIFIQVYKQHYLIVEFGNWQAPFGIIFAVDGLSAIMLNVTSVIALLCGIYALNDISDAQFRQGFLHAYWLLLLGITGAVSTGDLFNLYVWFEITLIASFILLGLGKPKKWLLNKFKYVVLNLLATMLVLIGIAFIYGMSGTLNMADLAVFFSKAGDNSLLALIVISFMFVAFAIKAGLFPVFSWLPASYHTTSFSATALMGGVLTKIGVYTIIRLFTLICPLHNQKLQLLLLFLAGATMISGVLGAAAQYDYRRILTFHVVSQIGYMLLGLAVFTVNALAACLFFIVHNVVTKTALFLTSGIAHRLTGAVDIRQMGGLYQQAPGLSLLFFIAAFALAGLPPLSGFWGKYLLIQSALAEHHIFSVIVALAVSMITLYSMIKIWNYAYWQTPQSTIALPSKAQHAGLMLPTLSMVAIVLALSFFPQFFYNFMLMAARQLMEPAGYITAVLGGAH